MHSVASSHAGDTTKITGPLFRVCPGSSDPFRRPSRVSAAARGAPRQTAGSSNPCPRPEGFQYVTPCLPVARRNPAGPAASALGCCPLRPRVLNPHSSVPSGRRRIVRRARSVRPRRYMVLVISYRWPEQAGTRQRAQAKMAKVRLGSPARKACARRSGHPQLICLGRSERVSNRSDRSLLKHRSACAEVQACVQLRPSIH